MKTIFKCILICVIVQFFNCKGMDNKYVIKLDNLKNTQYVGRIFVGSNNQEINVIFSTGSSMIWFPTSECETCRNTTNKFNKESSETLKTFNTPFTYKVNFYFKV